MTYNITLPENHTLKDKEYLFDANVWIFMFDPLFQPPKNDNGDKYSAFFQTLKNSNKKVVIPLLLFSEVINRYLRICCTHFYNNSFHKEDEKNDSRFFKNKYRKSKHFSDDFDRLKNNFLPLVKYCQVVSDIDVVDNSFQIVNGLFDFPIKNMDFNDHVYYLLAKNKNYIIVTNDWDFHLKGIEIVTLQHAMIPKK